MKSTLNVLLVVLGLLFSTLVWSQDNPSELNGAGIFKFNDAYKAIFHDIHNLRLKQATLQLNQIKNKNAFNLLSHYFEDYIDFYYAFIDGKPKDIYGKYMDHKEERLAWFKQGGDGDPYTLFIQADVHLRWGMIYALFHDNIEAFKSIKKASVLLEKNNKKFPGFMPNKRALGMLHTMVGAIPGKYQWGASLAGLTGNVNQGLDELKAVIEHGKQFPEFEFNEEVQIMYGMLLLYMGNKDINDWGDINKTVMDFTKNPMAAYILANKNLKIGRDRQAMLILSQYPTTSEFYNFPYLEIMKGNAKLFMLDFKAEAHFNNFLSTYRGVNGIKEAYHKLAWINLLRSDEPKYRYFMSMVEKKGEYNTAEDKKAMNEMESAKQRIIPNKTLLKARLLFDGGNYERSFHELENLDKKSLKSEQEKIEFDYRMGRVYHKMRKYTDALKYYDEALKKGSKKPYYYACNAALQAGTICETKKDSEKAKIYYEKCLKENPDQYKATLHSKAKAKLADLKDK